MTNPICYSDTIYLQVENLLLYSNDFHGQTLYLAPAENAVNNSFRNGLFKIYPKFPHDNSVAIKRAEHQLKLSAKVPTLNNSKQEVEVEKDILNEITRLEESNQSQAALIVKIINETQGQPIRYGQELQFLHVESHLFVSLSNDFNENNQDITGLELAHQGDKPASFMFHPRLAYTYNGDIVEYDTPLDFISADTKAPLVKGVKMDQFILDKGSNPTNNPLTDQEDKFPRIEPRGKKSLSETVEMFQTGISLNNEEGDKTYIRKFVSFEDEERAHKKKLLRNGDYIRISNERIYMTAYNSGNDSPLFFQEFKDGRGFNYSIIYSLFQITELISDQNSQENHESYREHERAPNLPEGHILEYNPTKRYMLKHLISGKYLTLDSESVKLSEYAKIHEESMKLSIVMRRNERGDPSNKYICQNSIYELRFNHEALDQKRKILAIGAGEELFTKQPDFTGSYCSGFKLTDDYLNKFLLTERLDVEAKGSTDDRFSSFRLIHPKEIEISSRFQAEYLANQFQKFLNSLAKFTREPPTANKLLGLNEEAANLSLQCNKYTNNTHEEVPGGVSNKTEVANTIRQVLLREYRVFDLMYRVLYYTLLDSNVLEKARLARETDLKSTKTDQLRGVLDLLRSIEKLFIFSYLENDLNRYYCSQFIRVTISCAFYPDSGMFSLATGDERQEVKNIVSQLCMSGLWNQDTNAFRQLNQYKSIFKSREKQISYDPTTLKLLNHIMKSEIPKVHHDFRNVFVQTFLADDSNIEHLFPQVYEEEKKIYLKYSQGPSQNREPLLCLSDLNSELFDLNKVHIDYFIEASKLICTLKKIGSPMFDSKIAEHYQLDVLKRAAQCIDTTPSYHQLRTAILKLIREIFDNYAPGLFKKLPANIYINIEDEKTQAKSLVLEINSALKESAEQGASKTDTKYLKLQSGDGTLKDLKLLIPASIESIDECDNVLLQKYPDKLLDNIYGKLKNEKLELKDFNLACRTFDMLETNTVGSALAIVKKTLNHKVPTLEDEWNEINREGESKIAPLNEQQYDKQNSRQTEVKHNKLVTLLSMRDMKNKNKTFDPSKAFDIFLQASLLDQDKEDDYAEKGMNKKKIIKNARITEILQYLRRASSLNDSIYDEIGKIAFVFDLDTLNQIRHIVKATCRLNEISRTIIFHHDSSIKIEAPVLLDLLKEVLDSQWSLFFIIYDTSKHFRYHNKESDQNNRFKEAFQNIKTNSLNLYTKLSLHAVNRFIQKIFKILSTHLTFDTILQWATGHEAKSEILSQIIRLNTLLLTTYIMDNKENQMICSTMKGFVKQFYIKDSIKYNPDALILFGELFRGNKELLELSNPILYDITTAFLLKETKTKISNTQENACASASILNYQFWCQAAIPIALYSPFSDMKKKWNNIIQVDQFTSLNILQSEEDIIKLPYCYYSIRELLSSTIEALDSGSNKKEDGSIALQIPILSKLVSLFESENFILQYELKNMLAKCMIKVYFESGVQASFIKTEECKHITACLMADIVFYLKHAPKTNKEIRSNVDLTPPSFISKMEKYINITRMYEQIDKNDIIARKLQIYLEDVSLETLYSEYIFDGCFSLLLHILNKESDWCGPSITDEDSKACLALKFSVKLLESLNEVQPLHKNVNTYLAMMLDIPGSSSYIDEITKIRDTRLTNHIELKKPSSSEQRFEEHMSSTKVNKLDEDYNNEQNLQVIMDHIAGHDRADDIIGKMIEFLEESDIKSQKQDIIFVLKILRKYIAISFTRDLDKNIHFMWEDINCVHPKEVETIQEKYRNLGLTKILYKLYLQDDFEVFKEAISLSIVYVYGGNNKIQSEFYDNFTADKESEVLSKLNKRLSMCFSMFKTQESKRMHSLHTQCQKTRSRLFDQDVIAPDGGKILWHTQPAENKEETQVFLLIVTFFQALCEKQFTEMQTFLREHRFADHSYQRSFHFLGFLRDSTSAYCKVLNKYNLVVGCKLLDLVTELVQGDGDENIGVFLSHTLVYDLCKALKDHSTKQFASAKGFTDLDDKDLQLFKNKITMFFKIILESCNEHNRSVLKEHLDIKGLIEVFKGSMFHFRRSDLDNNLNIYMTLRYLWNDLSDAEFYERLLESSKDTGYFGQDGRLKTILEIYKHYFLYSIEIMIKRKTKTLIRVWFPRISELQIVPTEMIYGFLGKYITYVRINNVSRLLEHSKDIIALFKVIYETKKGEFHGIAFRFFHSMILIYNYPAVLAINIINIATYKLENTTTFQDSYYHRQVRNIIIAEIVFASLTLFFCWRSFRSANVLTNWEKYIEKNNQKMKSLSASIKHKLDSRRYSGLTKDECYTIIKLKGVSSEEFQLIREHSLTFKRFKFWLSITDVWFSVKSSEIISSVIFLAITIGSLFHPLVAMLQLCYMVSKSATVQQISKAVFKNSNQLIWTLALLLFVTATYSTIGFFFLNHIFVDTNDNNSRFCDTAFACFINVLNFGIRSGGGIGDVIQPIPYEDDNKSSFFWMAIFNLSFYVLVIVLLLSIIFGMIIDAFGEIRDDNTKTVYNMKNVCAVCGLERAEFEKYTDFEQHRKVDHNIWSYVFYIAYLLSKQKNDKNSLTEIENYVLDMYRTKNDDWLPIGRSITLERAYEEEKVDKESEIDVLTKKIDDIASMLKDKALKAANE